MKLQLDGIAIEIISLAGFYTCVQFPGYKIAIDLGVAPRSSFNKSHVFFTHAHGDHIAGVVRHCSSRDMLGLEPPTYYIGQEDVANFYEFMDSARKLCRTKMACDVQAVQPGDHFQIRPDLRVTSYRSIHRVPCQGYVISNTRKKLREEFLGADPQTIRQARENGVAIDRDVEIPLVSYTGDTIIDVFEREQQLQNVRVLITELTFCDHHVEPEDARHRGHIHLQHILDRAHLFQQPNLVFMHFSSRYRTQEIESICRKRMPKEMFERSVFVPNDAPLHNF